LKKNAGKWVPNYFTFTTIMTASLIGFWPLLPQQMNFYLLPLVFVILIRALVIRQSVRS
jgi:hypothetical protein